MCCYDLYTLFVSTLAEDYYSQHTKPLRWIMEGNCFYNMNKRPFFGPFSHSLGSFGPVLSPSVSHWSLTAIIQT